MTSRTPSTAGMPYSRATMAACDSSPPVSATTAEAEANSGVQAGSVAWQTRTSPGRRRVNSAGPAMTRTGPEMTPGLAATPVMPLPGFTGSRSGCQAEGAGPGAAAPLNDPRYVHRFASQPAQQLIETEQRDLPRLGQQPGRCHPAARFEGQAAHLLPQLLEVHDPGLPRDVPGAVVVDEAQEPAAQEPGQPAGGLGHQVGVGSRGGRFAPLGVRHHRDRPEEGGKVLAP